ncbi:MBL fold metallo-hydrolase [Sporichthya sp.]|uniref:MBL fold metallo-hydrolase n=1 Tax=Sporichthya sp. TaxID=65475 RepID=UPI001834A26E|nr:MBL fold metallo-hydrolase [Sporichthya sp.]MBA3745111.1 MBL fold metallo-hydrolase [Sporichthya sp.]
MKLTVVGCSGSFPGPSSPASCYLLEADGYKVLLDMGSGALGALQRYTDVYDIDAVVLSHLHADHCMDLCGYYVARKYRPEGPAPKIPVYGPADSAGRMARAYDLPMEPGMNEEFAFTEYPSGAFELGPLRITTDLLVHPIDSFGMRIEHGGKTLTYSGDTGACDGLVRLAKDSDLFLCEASFHDGRDDAPTIHLNGREAAEHAARAGTQKLVLTHIPPWNDMDRTLSEAACFDGPTELARPGAVYTL